LDYLNARYYESTRGQFISQDPVFWEIGLSQDGKNALSNPQALNSYGYANDNPISSKDPTGRCTVCAGLEVAYSLTAQATYDSAFGRSSPAVYGGDIVGGAMYGFAYRYAIGFPEPVAAISAAAGNVAQQGFEYLSGEGILLFLLTYFGPRYIGIIPGIIGMATWIVLLGRAVGKSFEEKHPDTKRPWWTSL
jgi:RHS repeat-associated protein